MNGIILDKIKEKSANCFLTKIKLGDYIKALSANYQDYEIQREIVTNIYLDNLIQTVLEKKHIPPIVLVVEGSKFEITTHYFETIEFKILDGLQRTFRLKAIFDTMELLKEELKEGNEIFELTKIQISRKYKEKLEKINSSTFLITRELDFLNKNKRDLSLLYDVFERYQWFEIWTNLSPQDEINKMLILNAGHKPVKTKHQLELLFLNVISILQKMNFQNFVILREKDVSSNLYSKSRRQGEFHFSQLITSLLSFAEGKPLTTNVDLIQKKQTDYFEDDIFDKYMQYDFLKEFVDTLVEIDKCITKEYGSDGIKWMGRETSLVGLFAAAGKYEQDTVGCTPTFALHKLKEVICNNPKMLALKEFEASRNSMDLAKVNIGSINKRAVYNGILEVLKGQITTLTWFKYFKN
jgi:hypothetical protein